MIIIHIIGKIQIYGVKQYKFLEIIINVYQLLIYYYKLKIKKHITEIKIANIMYFFFNSFIIEYNTLILFYNTLNSTKLYVLFDTLGSTL